MVAKTLDFDGILALFKEKEPPSRLADYWLAAKSGIARGRMDPITFYLYDQADGSRGRVPLEVQRQEHLEMWMLLGDPALRLPLEPPAIRLEVVGAAGPGKSIAVRGSLAPTAKVGKIRVTIERPIGSVAPELKPLPVEPAEARDLAMLENHERANSVVLASRDANPLEGRFECTFTLPAELPWERLTVRAQVAEGGEAAMGVETLPVHRGAEAPVR